MHIVPLLIQLISGAAGGNAAGSLMKNSSLGVVWNSVLGIIGGGLGGQLLGLLGIAAAPSGSMDLGSIVGSVLSGGVGGGVLLAIVGAVKKSMAK
jgi:uncharacterized membrane protein YeaQ/YmgE (transglycosylase-associated protein family)